MSNESWFRSFYLSDPYNRIADNTVYGERITGAEWDRVRDRWSHWHVTLDGIELDPNIITSVITGPYGTVLLFTGELHGDFVFETRRGLVGAMLCDYNHD